MNLCEQCIHYQFSSIFSTKKKAFSLFGINLETCLEWQIKALGLLIKKWGRGHFELSRRLQKWARELDLDLTFNPQGRADIWFTSSLSNLILAPLPECMLNASHILWFPSLGKWDFLHNSFFFQRLAQVAKIFLSPPYPIFLVSQR